MLSERLPDVKIVNDKPDILALIDVLTLTVTLDVRSAYVYGRYKKYERGIPQTRWPCRACKGQGVRNATLPANNILQVFKILLEIQSSNFLKAANMPSMEWGGKTSMFDALAEEDRLSWK